MFFASTMVMVTVALVMAVIVTNIYAKKESPERAPDWCIAIVSRFYPKYFSPNKEIGSRLKEANRKGKGKRQTKGKHSTANCNVQLLRPFPSTSPGTSGSMAAGNRATQKPEVDIETGNEIVQHTDDPDGNGNGNKPSAEVIAGDSRCESDYNDAPGGNKSDVDQAIADRKRKQDKHDRRRNEMEWKLVATFTDRVFFWVFLILSVAVQIVLFLQIVPKWSTK